jgi:hypothetical protein
MNRPGGRRRGVAPLSVVAAVSAAAALLAGCGGGAKKAAKSALRVTTTTVARTTTTRPKHVSVCPLTGAPSPSGKLPRRAAIAVKVENLPAARPQWGLDQADIVFEEPVEGGITRFIAVYQCQGASRIEPVRSARLVDAQILEPLGKILFAYSGAIQPVIQEVDSPTSLLEDVGADTSGQAYWRDPTRVEPHNLATSTKLLQQAAAAKGYPEPPPKAIFNYGTLPAGGKPVIAAHVDYPLDITSWTWSSKSHRWLRSYACPPGEQQVCTPEDNGPAMLGGGEQISAANVVVMHVFMYPTQYVEDATGAHENELTLTGTGPAWVFRDGEEFVGRWVRPALTDPATFEEQDGTKLTLAPGNTWEELVPDGQGVTVTGRPRT